MAAEQLPSRARTGLDSYYLRYFRYLRYRPTPESCLSQYSGLAWSPIALFRSPQSKSFSTCRIDPLCGISEDHQMQPVKLLGPIQGP